MLSPTLPAAPHPASAAGVGKVGPGLIEHVAAIFAPLAGARGLLLAVSGGPDSLALLRLAAAWQQAHDAPPLHVATVDHGLRAASRAEATQVAAWAAALGLPHHLLTWDGAKPKTRIQEAAREARYRLLCALAVKLGVDHLVTGHHADDQAETVLFRLLRGSGVGGLAGMAPLSGLGGVIVARPLLGLTKTALIAHCAAVGQPFIEDPSNQDPAYARTRLRRLGARLAREGLDRDALLRLARRAARLEAALAPQLAGAKALLAIDAPGDGSRSFPARLLAEVADEIALRLLKEQIEATAPPGRQLRLERLETLSAALRHALCNRLPHAASLGGVLLRLDRTGRLTLRPEPPRRRGRGLPFDGTAR